MRAEFETFCRKRNLICERERDKKLGYAYAETETAWLAYQAGAIAMRERAAILSFDYDGQPGFMLREAIRALAVDVQSQRERINQRLGDRAKGPVNLDDCGVPHLREE